MLFSALLPGEQLKSHHVVGALIALAGTAVLFFGRGGIGFAQDYLPGFAAAFVAAFTWAVYSVLSRRFAAVPTDAVAGFCLATAALAAIFHLAFEQTQWPQGAANGSRCSALGIGPVGCAFYVWDIGMKRGDIRILGVASYLAPLLSTAFLVLAGYAAASLVAGAAAVLVAGGGSSRRRKDMIAAEKLGAWRCPVRRRHLEARELKSRRDRAADQRPVAERFRRLPVTGRHDALRPLAGREIGAELHAPDRSVLAPRPSRAPAARPHSRCQISTASTRCQCERSPRASRK